MANDYGTVTELSGTMVTREQVERMTTRYRFAAEFAQGRDVLEVACGSGQGLGLLAKGARSVTGGDIDEKILERARETYKGRERINIRPLDAQQLPFPDASLDVVILYEAIYYIPDAVKFCAEARRVLRQDGILIICSANCSLPDFNPSPFSYRYFSATQLKGLLQAVGFRDIALYGDCPVPRGPKATVISFIKKAAVTLHLIPKTMKGKELFKRIFYGKLVVMPHEIGEDGDYTRPSAISVDRDDTRHRVIFATGRK